MGHIRLGTLSQSKKWRDVVGLLESDAPLHEVAEAAARASELDLARASNDPAFQFVSSLLVRLPLLARAPGFEDALEDLGLRTGALASATGFLAELSNAFDRKVFELGRTSDPGELARSAFLESLSVLLRDRFATASSSSSATTKPQDEQTLSGSAYACSFQIAMCKRWHAEVNESLRWTTTTTDPTHPWAISRRRNLH